MRSNTGDIEYGGGRLRCPRRQRVRGGAGAQEEDASLSDDHQTQVGAAFELSLAAGVAAAIEERNNKQRQKKTNEKGTRLTR